MEASQTSPSRPVSLGGGVGGFVTGISAVFSGLGVLLKNAQYRGLALKPLLITIVVYLMVGGGAVVGAPTLLEQLWHQPESGWQLYLWYVLVPVIVLAIAVVLVLLFVAIASVISGPFYEKMANLILSEHGLTLHDPGLVKGTTFEIVRNIFFFGPALTCALLGLIPVIGVPFAVAGAGIGWLGLASAAINPALVVSGHTLGEQLRSPFSSLTVMLGVGAVIALSLFVPILGLVSVPSAVIGLTTLYAKKASGA